MAVPSFELVSGYKIPAVGLGTWQSSDEKELEGALNAALENGYRHIDTAFVYQNEHIIGRVIKEWLTSGKVKREELFITTKLPMDGIATDKVEPYIKKSLESLQLDYVDLYLIHFPVATSERKNPTDPFQTIPTDHVAVWKKLEEQVDAGRTRSIGISNFNLKQVERIVKNARIKPASLQIENHIFLQQKELIKYAQEQEIVVVAYSPLGSPGYGKFVARFGLEAKPVPSIFEHPKVNEIAKKHGKTPAHVALKFQLQRKVVVIPKSVTANRVKENINLFDFTLDEQDMKALSDLDVGEAARVCDFKFAPVLADHPEWPFPK
uniref:NADP-dependent oxidoreductase domain-containing protein n=1 Tax=Dendroctonus ponderosae TaxID=77166 RepID=J3JXH1_DENPD|nr:unknown [Dendroctonus ponderosae]